MKIAIIGYGKMGHIIESVARREGVEVGALFDIETPLREDEKTGKVLDNIDVCIDFSVPEAVVENIRICCQFSKNLVVGTTGWHERVSEVREMVENSSVGLVYAPNFSIGVNLFYRIVEKSATLFKKFDQYDAYIEEAHHKFKKDAPSGTAIFLRNIVERIYNKEIPVSSVRAGYIPGVHAVSFDSSVDSIRLQHSARSREGFAEGALFAARWILNKKGFFEFSYVLDKIIEI